MPTIPTIGQSPERAPVAKSARLWQLFYHLRGVGIDLPHEYVTEQNLLPSMINFLTAKQEAARQQAAADGTPLQPLKKFPKPGDETAHHRDSSKGLAAQTPAPSEGQLPVRGFLGMSIDSTERIPVDFLLSKKSASGLPGTRPGGSNALTEPELRRLSDELRGLLGQALLPLNSTADASQNLHSYFGTT